MRGVSTVVDATLFLLVLGVAVATLVGVPAVVDEEPVDRADAIAEHLATGTERVDYSLAPAARALDGGPPRTIGTGPAFRRSAHGTFASLLADAAVATVTVDGERLSVDGDAFEAAVVNATERRTRQRNVSVRVSAIWKPYLDAPVEGRVTTGERPPPTADVNAATIGVDGAMPKSRKRARAVAETDGYRGVARVVANATVEGLFPPERTRLALRGDYPVDALVADRYADFRDALGAKPRRPRATDDVDAVNAELTALFADRLERDLRSRFETPTAAARNVSTGTVSVTVRTWSR